MCSSSPKIPTTTEADKPAVLMTARDGTGAAPGSSQNRNKLRIDLNNGANNAYGSSLVIPT